jgi:xylitol oxidase
MSATAVQNWAGALTYRASAIRHPESVEEIQALVRGAQRFKALGTRHAFSDAADTEGVLICTDQLIGMSPVDPNRGVVEFGSGVTYGALCRSLHEQRYVVRNLASLPHISIAGACATGTHGSGIRNGNLATAVRGLQMVTASGDRIEIGPEDSEFQGAVVNLGALGIVTRVTLEVVPDFDVRQVVYETLPFKALEDNFEAVLSAGYSVSLFTSWNGDEFEQVWVKLVGEAAADDLFGARRADAQRHPLPGMPADYCTTQMNEPGPAYERLPHFKMEFTPSSGDELQSEWLVPLGRGIDALRAIRGIAGNLAPAIHVSEIRTVASDDLWMSPSFGRASLCIHFTWKKQPDLVRRLVPRVEAALAPFGPRPHWGKIFALRADELRKSYPRFDDFVSLARRLDPAHKLCNDFLTRSLGL